MNIFNTYDILLHHNTELESNAIINWYKMTDVNFFNASKPKNEKVIGENTNLDPETAKRLFEVGAHLILLNVPLNTEIGVDMNSWNTGPNFKGIKMIPPGVHFIYWR